MIRRTACGPKSATSDKPYQQDKEGVIDCEQVPLPPSVEAAAGLCESTEDTVRARNPHQRNRTGSVFDVYDEVKEERNGGAQSAVVADEEQAEVTGKKQEDSTAQQGSAAAKPPLHRRSVSWGRPNIMVDRSSRNGSLLSSDDLQQPNLKDFLLDEESGAAPSLLQRNISTSSTPSHRRKLSSIDLEDLSKTNPLEVEAEAYIIQAIEQRDQPRARAESGVMSHVPDEAVSHMSSSLREEGPQSPQSVLSSSERDHSSRAPDSKSPEPSVPMRRHHRHTQTMEEKLFGLASAIDAIHAAKDSASETLPPPPPRGRTNTVESTKSDAISSAEAFQQNASLLYRRIKNEDAGKEDEGSLHSTESGRSQTLARWRLIKNVIHATNSFHPKKTDEIISDNDGPENGETGSKDEEPRGLQSGEGGSDNGNDVPSTPNWKQRLRLVDEWDFTKEFQDFLGPYKGSIRSYVKIVLFWIMIPITGVAAILYYLAGNPKTGVLQNNGRPINGTLVNTDGQVVDPMVASASWWLIFLCIRQLITFSLAKAMEIIVIDILSIRTKATFQLLGAYPTLFILQSRGWPFVLFFWGIFNFALLSGSKPFSRHWLFWQSAIGLCNQSNPSGHVVDSEWYHRILAITVSVAAVVSVKRFWMGLYFGRQTFTQFSDKLAAVMKKILLISQVASLARDLEKDPRSRAKNGHTVYAEPSFLTEDRLEGLVKNAEEDSSSETPSFSRSESSLGYVGITSPVIDPDDRHPFTGSLSSAQKTRIVQLLGAWEEPTITERPMERVSVDALLQFRRALACLRTDFPFSGSFGPAGTREEAIASSQVVFRRLLSANDEDRYLSFKVIAKLGVQPDGSLDQEKLVDLIKLFRPDRSGKLSMLDFVKSVDSVYRELHLLRASVINSSKIDAAFENIFNIIFYAVVIVVVLSVLGFDPLALFISISGVVLAFAFMIGPASSKYFEGLLFILVRRPYAIGDAIHASNPDSDTESTGSGWWLVEDVTLFTTTVVYLYTDERATLSNGSLANSRIINATRSPHACLFILLKFPVDVSYEKLLVFNKAVEQYVRNRPREWLGLLSFRATRVEASEGYVEYILVVKHRESWARWLALRTSQAHLATFCLELSKQLHIRYKSPPLPVDLSIASGQGNIVLEPTHHLVGSNVSGMQLSPGSSMGVYSPDLRALQEKFAPTASGSSKKIA